MAIIILLLHIVTDDDEEAVASYGNGEVPGWERVQMMAYRVVQMAAVAGIAT